ncbi:MAG: hypothetical protein IJX51_05815 [Clostridia bacterium]|nr:hypothetical protein [Clostridia bacterium]
MFLFSATDDAPFLGWVVTTDIVIYAIAIGVFLSFVAFWFVQNISGSIVRDLLNKAKDESSALSLDELGKNKAIYRHMLREGKVLRNTIACVGGSLPVIEGKRSSEEEAEKGFFKKLWDKIKNKFTRTKYDYSNAKFYIPEDGIEKAEARYSKSFKTWWLPVIFVLCIAIAFGMTFLMPIIMDLIRG